MPPFPPVTAQLLSKRCSPAPSPIRCPPPLHRPQYPLYSATIKLYGGTLLPYFLEESQGWQATLKHLQEQVDAARRWVGVGRTGGRRGGVGAPPSPPLQCAPGGGRAEHLQREHLHHHPTSARPRCSPLLLLLQPGQAGAGAGGHQPRQPHRPGARPPKSGDAHPLLRKGKQAHARLFVLGGQGHSTSGSVVLRPAASLPALPWACGFQWLWCTHPAPPRRACRPPVWSPLPARPPPPGQPSVCSVLPAPCPGPSSPAAGEAHPDGGRGVPNKHLRRRQELLLVQKGGWVGGWLAAALHHRLSCVPKHRV